MMHRSLFRVLHAAFGSLALVTVSVFMAWTLWAELLGDAADIATAKLAIVKAVPFLVITMAAAGASGFRLRGAAVTSLVAQKAVRMKVAALNGLLVLVPAALFLGWKAQAGSFDTLFYAVQAVELAAGAVNITLLGLNVRDGLVMRSLRTSGDAAALAADRSPGS